MLFYRSEVLAPGLAADVAAVVLEISTQRARVRLAETTVAECSPELPRRACAGALLYGEIDARPRVKPFVVVVGRLDNWPAHI